MCAADVGMAMLRKTASEPRENGKPFSQEEAQRDDKLSPVHVLILMVCAENSQHCSSAEIAPTEIS